MSYQNSASDRLDELRYRSQQSPGSDTSLLGMVSPPRTGTRLAQPTNPPQDSRVGLMRRFTTDSGRAPTLPTGISHWSSQDIQDYGHSLEKKKLDYERLREQKRRFEAEMQLLDLQQRRDEQELAQMQEDLGRSSNPGQGHQSEPTTPPEINDSVSGFPSAFSRPNRYSTSSLTSPGLFNLSGRSNTQITSPQTSTLQSRLLLEDKILSNSITDSRRSIDEDEKAEAVRQDPTSHRSTNAFHRYSMPVTKTRSSLREMALDQTNTAHFLFGEDEPSSSSGVSLQVNATEENFPILVRREDYPGLLSASSAALDLALSQCPGPESNTWNTFYNRHRASRSQQGIQVNSTQLNGSSSACKPNGSESPASVRQSYRHSLDLKYRQNFDIQQDKVPHVAPSCNQIAAAPKLQSTFSTKDAQTSRSTSNGGNTVANGHNTRAQQYFHNHNASLGRIPHGMMNNMLNRELTPNESTVSQRENQNLAFPSIHSALHANAPSFGSPSAQNLNQTILPAPLSPTPSQSFTSQQSYYGMQMMMPSAQNMSVGQYGYTSPNSYAYNSNQVLNPSRPQQPNSRENQARISQNRRQNDGDVMSRFANLSLESLDGEIYALCKDQHGCRYLQKKLEERNPDEIHQIWLETNQHVIEFMTDPFGNYLCQKLLEYCNDKERTVLIENASHDLVRIALNQHGTRALQKMIEHITTQEQIDTIVKALRYRVVELIQDLNGNHVIQKCLNKLTSQDAQFIFDAVGSHCVDVGTHRHGCCVLQRCIDHADGKQKTWLIRQISNNAYVLVQDPFGNYVVQYILDLNEPAFTEPLVATFKGKVSQLSKQKFSSNVIEKCLRCAQEPTKDALIEELLQPNEIDRVLHDSFANYVIQTALDYASPTTKTRLIEAIRPHLPAIRSTPYGRRIQAKISGSEGRSNNTGGGQVTATENIEPIQIPLRHSRGGSTASSSNFMAPLGGSYPTGYGVSGLNNNVMSNRNIQSGGGPFPSTEQLASPLATQQPNSYTSYHRNSSNHSGNSNWV